MATLVFATVAIPSEAATLARIKGGSVWLQREPGKKEGRRLSSLTRSGKVRNLLVVRQKGEWLGLRTPWRPNGGVWWSPAQRFHLKRTRYKIVVDTSRSSLVFWRAGRRVWRTSVVVGKASTPTPHGLFALSDFYKTGGDMRPWVFETTAQSEVFGSWLGGPPRMALHGRHGSLWAPWGSASSNGCIRTPSWALRKIRKRAEVGMPILVQG